MRQRLHRLIDDLRPARCVKREVDPTADHRKDRLHQIAAPEEAEHNMITRACLGRVSPT
jgi:hypothetical protein